MKAILGVAAGLLMAASLPTFAAVKNISTCRYMITQPGEYHLTTNLTCPVGYAITISSSDVELHFDGHTLDGNKTGLAGVLISNVWNVDIDGDWGTVQNFATGILFTNCSDSSVTNINALNSFPTPGPAFGTGILLENCCKIKVSCNKVKGNLIQGIEILGDNKQTSSNNVIENNDVNVNAAGIVLANGTDNWIVWNTVDNNKSLGILLYKGSTDNFIGFNEVLGNLIKDITDQNACGANTYWWNNFGTANLACIH